MTRDKKQKGKVDMQKMMEVYKRIAIPGAPHKHLASLNACLENNLSGRPISLALRFAPRRVPTLETLISVLGGAAYKASHRSYAGDFTGPGPLMKFVGAFSNRRQ